MFSPYYHNKYLISQISYVCLHFFSHIKMWANQNESTSLWISLIRVTFPFIAAKKPLKMGSSESVVLLTVSLLCFCHSPPLLASLPAVGNMWWRCVSCCHAVLLGNKALVWMGWQVVKISSVWEMSVFPSTFCLLLSIICEQQTADVSAP